MNTKKSIKKTNSRLIKLVKQLLHWIAHLKRSGGRGGKQVWVRQHPKPVPIFLFGTKENNYKQQNIFKMKSKERILKWLGLLFLLVSISVGSWAQTLPDNSPTQTVCPGTEPYEVVPGDPNNTFTWSITPGTSGVEWTIVPGANPYQIEVLWANPASTSVFTLTVEEEHPTYGCATEVSMQVTVTPDNTILLSSAAGTDAQTVCINEAIVDITYATTGATGATITGLPAGVTGSWNADVVTITGTPTESGTFNYEITLTGGCGTVTESGTIDVIPLPATSPIWHN